MLTNFIPIADIRGSRHRTFGCLVLKAEHKVAGGHRRPTFADPVEGGRWFIVKFLFQIWIDLIEIFPLKPFNSKEIALLSVNFAILG